MVVRYVAQNKSYYPDVQVTSESYDEATLVPDSFSTCSLMIFLMPSNPFSGGTFGMWHARPL